MFGSFLVIYTTPCPFPTFLKKNSSWTDQKYSTEGEFTSHNAFTPQTMKLGDLLSFFQCLEQLLLLELMTCQCQWWWMWSSPAPPRHRRAVKNNASVCCSHRQSALSVLPQTSSLRLFFLAIYVYRLVIVCCLLNLETTTCVTCDGWSALCLLVNVCMQFKSVFDSYWVKWAICSTSRIESELKLWNRFAWEIVVRTGLLFSATFHIN